MEAKPLVSIIINNHNYGRFLRDAIDSALAQTYAPREVVVVDDGSEDDSRPILAKYGSRVIAVLKDNAGQASAFNSGFAASRGELICFEDADDFFLPEKAECVVESFQRNPQAGWCLHPVTLVDQHGTALENTPVHSTAQERPVECDFRAHIRRGHGRFVEAPTSGLCFRRELLKKILPMPESITITSDNYVKFAAFGLSEGLYLESALSCQRIHASNAFTRRYGDAKERLHGRIKLLTAYWLTKNYPRVRRFSDKLFASGVISCQLTGGVDRELRPFIREYLVEASVLRKSIIALHAARFFCFSFRRHAQHRNLPATPARAS